MEAKIRKRKHRSGLGFYGIWPEMVLEVLGFNWKKE